ncbi:hypothetical protein AMR41_03615 [Hapalosiphon sp. MRB220]|nr:hypothetical protein AMR41_03615 [Hapalosiphon sp. MRB220]
MTNIGILESLTTIRRQTAIDPESASSAERSLRSARVSLRELSFESTRFCKLDDEEMIVHQVK